MRKSNDGDNEIEEFDDGFEDSVWDAEEEDNFSQPFEDENEDNPFEDGQNNEIRDNDSPIDTPPSSSKNSKKSSPNKYVILLLLPIMVIAISAAIYFIAYLPNKAKSSSPPVVKLATKAPAPEEPHRPKSSPDRTRQTKVVPPPAPDNNEHKSNNNAELTPLPFDINDDDIELPPLMQIDDSTAENVATEDGFPTADNDPFNEINNEEELPLLEDKLLSKTEESPDNKIYGNPFADNDLSVDEFIEEADFAPIKEEKIKPAEITKKSPVIEPSIEDETRQNNIHQETENKPDPVPTPVITPEAEAKSPVPVKKPAKIETAIKEPAPSPKTKEAVITEEKKYSPTWEIRGIHPGSAILYDAGKKETRTVEVGNKIDGLGTIKAIKKVQGLWVVIGSKKTITQ